MDGGQYWQWRLKDAAAAAVGAEGEETERDDGEQDRDAENGRSEAGGTY